MRKILRGLLAVCVLFNMWGCSDIADIVQPAKSAEKVFVIDNYDLQITADSSFSENTGGEFDLQITNDNAYISIMAFAYIDIPSDLTPMDIFELQNEEIFNRRDSVRVVEEVETKDIAQGQVRQAVYSAEKDGNKNYYATYLIDMPEEEVCAWVLVTAMPSYMDKNREYLQDIVCSLQGVE